MAASRSRGSGSIVPVLRDPEPLARPPRPLLGAHTDTLDRTKERIREQARHRLLTQEASEVLTTAGGLAISRLHANAQAMVTQTAGVIVGRTEAVPTGTMLRQIIDDWNATQLPAYTRHMRGVLEAGAFAIAETIEQPFAEDVPEAPGLWHRVFRPR